MKISLGRNDIITLVGSLMVAIGAFLPMVEIGRIGTMSYADAADPEVYLLVAFALAATVVIFLDKRKFSLFAAIGAWLVLLWPVIKNMGGDSGDDGGLMGKLSKVTDPIQKAASDVAGRIFSNVFDMEIGGLMFVLGMIVMTVGAVMAFMAAKKA
ncbi:MULTISPECIES: hypothetical protein [Kordiimonas]|jgi:uncharacterized membrane protein YgdD (TMEM256/DUF423 family)|uniref:Uncharacterized protein n=1 Tax=Kordiimonas lacus TaxID=637679 RepID=A0A1G7CBD5_9PROT|nr:MULTISPECIES: hypothetical protein [Kordiimonas]SDE36621.1 hypothetical protein SAMN04488071_2733 [Kordiimonas lacus]